MAARIERSDVHSVMLICRYVACVNQIKTIHNDDGNGHVTKQRVSKENNGCALALEIMVHVPALIHQILRCLQSVNHENYFLTIL